MTPTADRIVADFMKASTALETYLHRTGTLTNLQEQSLDTTLFSLRTLFDSWRLHRSS
jgi:hypothetical protein